MLNITDAVCCKFVRLFKDELQQCKTHVKGFKSYEPSGSLLPEQDPGWDASPSQVASQYFVRFP